MGTDVNLIHRLTKNTVVKRTGIQAYSAYTEVAVNALGIGEYATQFVRHTEQYDHIGEVHILVQDLDAVWQGGRFAAIPDKSTRYTFSP